MSVKTWRIWAKSDAIWPLFPMVSPVVQPRSQEKNKGQLPPSFQKIVKMFIFHCFSLILPVSYNVEGEILLFVDAINIFQR